MKHIGISLLVLVLGCGLGIYLDIIVGITSIPIYFGIGCFTGMISMAVLLWDIVQG